MGIVTIGFIRAGVSNAELVTYVGVLRGVFVGRRRTYVLHRCRFRRVRLLQQRERISAS